MRGLLLRAGLHLADLVVRSLPRGAAYRVAWVAGMSWYRFSPRRRGLVGESLSRVCAATGRPSAGRAFRRLVARAFVEYARYWMELLRAPHYPRERMHEIVRVEPEVWARWEPVLRGGAVIAVPHLGNFEPFGHFMVAQGLRTVAPIEETEPRELFEFLLARRAGGQHLEIVPLGRAFRPMLAALRNGDIAAMVADRDLGGDGVPVSLFGHATTLPVGPSALALRTGRPLVMARVLRVGPDRFRGDAWPVEAELTGERRADEVALTRALAARFEAAIAECPEQWWAVFQPYFGDQRRRAARRDALGLRRRGGS